MKSNAIISAFLAVSLATSGFAVAQGRGDRGDRDDRGRQEQAQRGGGFDHRQYDRRQANSRDDRGRPNNRRNDYRDHRDERGAGPDHQFFRGERLPVEYRHRSYVVDNWRSHHLNAPPRGYHWVQTGADYVLVAIATGVILQLFLHNEYD